VKRAFARAPWAPVTKKPQVPTDEECGINPRARSAKLRVARRDPTDPGAEEGEPEERE